MTCKTNKRAHNHHHHNHHPDFKHKHNLIAYTARRDFVLDENRNSRLIRTGEIVKLTFDQAKGLVYRGFLTQGCVVNNKNKSTSNCPKVDCMNKKLKESGEYKIEFNRKPKHVDISLKDQKLIDDSSVVKNKLKG